MGPAYYEIGKPLNKLIFERKLGHKFDIPGSGQWRMHNLDHESCWMCDNGIYTLVFWNKAFGWKDD